MPGLHDGGWAAWLEQAAAGEPTAIDWLVGMYVSRLRALGGRVLAEEFPADGRPDWAEAIDRGSRRLRAGLERHQNLTARHGAALVARHLRHGLATAGRSRARASRVRLAGAGIPQRDHALGHRWQAFLKGIDRLSPGHREVFLLAWFLGIDPRAAGRLCGRSTPAVRRVWQEARSLVAAHVEAVCSGNQKSPGLGCTTIPAA